MPRLPVAALICLLSALPAAACQPPANTAELRSELLADLNAVRRERGLAALHPSAALDRAAQAHACDNAERKGISHVSSDGGTLETRLRRVGYAYKTASENTGRGFGTGKRAVVWWMDSPGHRKNMLMRKTRDVGIGIALSAAPENRLHWVLDMGLSRN